MLIGMNTYHITDRYGRFESGKLEYGCLVFSVKDIISQDFTQVEILMDVYCEHPETLSRDNIIELREIAKRKKVQYSAHLPYKYIDLASLNERVRSASVQSILETIEKADEIGIDKLVLHPVGAEVKPLDTFWYPATQEVKLLIIHDMLAQLRISLKQILNKVSARRLCLENLPSIDFSHFLPLIEEFNLNVCVDVGHCVLRDIDPVIFIREHADRIGVVHLHDVVDYRDNPKIGQFLDHEPVGTGIVDVQGILQVCREINFNGPIVLEHLEEAKARNSAIFMKKKLAGFE
jgi:sugar phosphate isomerase/epimerase